MLRASKLLLPACGLILLLSPASGQDRVWLRASSADLELLTPAGAADAAAALAEIESLRATIRETAPAIAGTGEGLRIVAFSSEWEYREFRVNAHSPAYFVGGPGRPTIVLSRLARETQPALRHEFIHYLIRSSGHKLPLWLEEGLADALSGLDPEEARRRVRLLRTGRQVPWPALLSATPGSLPYENWAMARMFYSQSWALTESLISAAGGVVDDPAIRRWCGTGPGSAGQIESGVRDATNRATPQHSISAVARSGAFGVTPAPAALVLTALGRLSMQLGNFDGAERRLSAAAFAWPEAWAALGDLAHRRGRPLEARSAYRKAMESGWDDQRMLWRLALLEQDTPDGDMVPVLERILSLDPAHAEARLALASQYIHRGLWPDALVHLTTVRNAPPRWEEFYRRALQLALSRAAAVSASPRAD